LRKKITVLGSTGSIGTQTLAAASALGVKVCAISGNRNIELLLTQAGKFEPGFIVITDHDAYRRFIDVYDGDADVLFGEEGLSAICALDVDIVFNALVGFAGLRSTLDIIENGNDLALANKESMVAFGEQIMEKAALRKVSIIPVDSEHSAIFQCIKSEEKRSVRDIILTASGGPFRDLSKNELQNVTVEQALAHPNWNMGRKISVDSATMMNKGLEVIEAKHLFSADKEMIKVVIQRQSIIHSMVGFRDGSYMAHLGVPDMKIPIAYAITYPQRMKTGCGYLDFDTLGSLSFEKADTDKYPCLGLAYQALSYKNSMAVAMNAANEICVEAFLDKRIRFPDIPVIIEKIMEKHVDTDLKLYEDVLRTDMEIREKTTSVLGGL